MRVRTFARYGSNSIQLMISLVSFAVCLIFFICLASDTNSDWVTAFAPENGILKIERRTADADCRGRVGGRPVRLKSAVREILSSAEAGRQAPLRAVAYPLRVALRRDGRPSDGARAPSPTPRPLPKKAPTVE